MTKTIEQIQEELSRPFTKVGIDGVDVPDLKWLQKNVINGKRLFVPYVTNDQVKHRLNEVLGIDGWSTTMENSINGKFITCNLTIIVDGKEITRCDVGTANMVKSQDTDIDKVMASDSIKRAAMSFGVGLYVKEVPNVYLTVKSFGKFQFPIVYNSKKEEIVLDTTEKMNSYINTLNPYKAAFISIKDALSKEDQTLLAPNLKAIWAAMNTTFTRPE